MYYLITYLVYIAVLARAIGWNIETSPIPTTVWVVLVIFGIFLVSQSLLTQRFPLYPRFYALVQSALVFFMLYKVPQIDFLTMLFLPLSFQVVQFFGAWVGFAWIGAFILAMAGMALFGLEGEAGLTLVITGGVANLLMGSFAHLINRTEKRRTENQHLLTELQVVYRTLKNSATQTEALAAAKERHRLVRELHDSLTQTLFSMNLAVQSAQLSVGYDVNQAEEHLTRLQALTRNAASEVQALLGSTSPRTVAEGELVHALQQLVKERQEQDRLEVTLHITGQRILPQSVETNLYRIAQEALNNIVRHAGVPQADLLLSLDSPLARLEIIDQGCGFDLVTAEDAGGFGLTGMADRAKEIGWNLMINSTPGRGTHLRVEEKAA